MGDYYGSASTAQQQAAPAKQIDADKIFVGGLSWQTTEESLRYHFEQYGTVVSVEVMRDRVTGDPRGFAFVVFRDEETVDLVMAEPRHEINHKVVDVKRAQARGVAPPSIHHKDNNNKTSSQQQSQVQQESSGLTPEQLQNKVFVGGLPAHVDRDELKRVFERFGAVVDAIVMMDPIQRRSRGFGFVTFQHGSNGAQNAIAEQPIQMGDRQVEVKLATPKGDQPRTHAAPKTMGLRAGISSSSSSGEYAGLAASYGRNGWKAGYGSHAFGAAGWAVQGWEDGGTALEKSGFSFDMLKQTTTKRTAIREQEMPATKRARH